MTHNNAKIVNTTWRNNYPLNDKEYGDGGINEMELEDREEEIQAVWKTRFQDCALNVLYAQYRDIIRLLIFLENCFVS